MTNTTDDKRSKLETLRIDLPEIGDDLWNDHHGSDLDDSNPATAPSRPVAAATAREPRSKTAASAPRPDPALKRPAHGAKFKTREEVFEQRMAVMARRRAQLDAQRNRQARNWFAFTGALLFIGAGGLGVFYYKTVNNWTFLSSYSSDNPAWQVEPIAPAAPEVAPVVASSSSSHFQNALALITSPRVGQHQTVEDIADMPVAAETARPHKLRATPAQPLPPVPVKLAATRTELAKPAQLAKPAHKVIEPATSRIVRIAPTAMPAQPEAVYNLNRSQPSLAGSGLAGELIMVPAEAKENKPPARKVASLSPGVTSPKSGPTSSGTKQTRSSADEVALETALGLPSEALELYKPTLSGEKTAAGLLTPVLRQDGKPAGSLLERGDTLLLLGDIVSARQLYKHAFQQGDQKAAARIGSTYDPRIFAQLGVRGLRPDAKLALDWYNKAVDAGDEAARQAASSLSR